MNDEEAERERQKVRARVKNIRERKSKEEKETEKQNAKKRMQILRENKVSEKKIKSDAVIEYEKIAKKFRMRESRRLRTEEEHAKEKVSAKKGMKDFRDYGALREYHERSSRNRNEILDWKEYYKKGESFAKVLNTRKPDLIERINQEIREEKERDRKKEEQERERIEKEKKRRKDGIWEYNGESGEYYWTGEKEPEQIVDTCVYEPLTEEEKKLSEETEALHFKWWVEERTRERNEKRRQKYKENKEKLAIPLDPLPERELCPYEQLRENNIQERKEAMRKCGFFEDLDKTKKHIGLN